MAASHTEQPASGNTSPFTISHFFRTLRNYRAAILLSLFAIAVGYVIIAALVYLMTPTQRVTTLPFRLEFEGADVGRYPNGMKFSSAEIVNTPILTTVYNQNDIKRFTSFHAFSRAVYVLEANLEFERLVHEYSARLADPKLSPVDRERIQREFEGRKESISKNEYSLNFLSSGGAAKVPDATVKKVLSDILREWSQFAAREQHVLQYEVSVISPDVLRAPAAGRQQEYVVALQILRSKIYRVLRDMMELERLPGAKLVRTQKEKLALQDIRIELEEMIRFRLEPLMPAVRASGLIRDVDATLQFARAQLAHDERTLRVHMDAIEAIRTSIEAYTGENTPQTMLATAARSQTETPAVGSNEQPAQQGSDVILSESFIDRMLDLTQSAADTEYRQRLITDLRMASEAMIPAKESVAYDRDLIAQLESGTNVNAGLSAADVEREIAAMHGTAYEAVRQINEIYLTVSRNLNPATHMMTVTGVPTTRTQRNVSPQRLLVTGILVMLLSLPIVIGGVLLHSRLRREEEDEERMGITPAATV